MTDWNEFNAVKKKVQRPEHDRRDWPGVDEPINEPDDLVFSLPNWFITYGLIALAIIVICTTIIFAH